MKRFGWLFWLLIWGAVPASYAQIAALTGYCELGATPAKTSGLSSTNNLQGVIPKCTVAVYLTGTQTLATIYSDGSSTPLANPFTATTSGQWTFFSSVNVGYDMVLSGGVYPNIYPSPVTLTGLYPGFSFSGGGGSGNVLPTPQYKLFIQPNAGTQAIAGPSNISTDATGNNLTVPNSVSSSIDNNAYQAKTSSIAGMQNTITAAGATGSVVVPANTPQLTAPVTNLSIVSTGGTLGPGTYTYATCLVVSGVQQGCSSGSIKIASGTTNQVQWNSLDSHQSYNFYGRTGSVASIGYLFSYPGTSIDNGSATPGATLVSNITNPNKIMIDDLRYGVISHFATGVPVREFCGIEVENSGLDATDCIQAAINYAQSSGIGVVDFTPGAVYTVTKTTGTAPLAGDDGTCPAGSTVNGAPCTALAPLYSYQAYSLRITGGSVRLNLHGAVLVGSYSANGPASLTSPAMIACYDGSLTTSSCVGFVLDGGSGYTGVQGGIRSAFIGVLVPGTMSFSAIQNMTFGPAVGFDAIIQRWDQTKVTHTNLGGATGVAIGDWYVYRGNLTSPRTGDIGEAGGYCDACVFEDIHYNGPSGFLANHANIDDYFYTYIYGGQNQGNGRMVDVPGTSSPNGANSLNAAVPYRGAFGQGIMIMARYGRPSGGPYIVNYATKSALRSAIDSSSPLRGGLIMNVSGETNALCDDGVHYVGDPTYCPDPWGTGGLTAGFLNFQNSYQLGTVQGEDSGAYAGYAAEVFGTGTSTNLISVVNQNQTVTNGPAALTSNVPEPTGKFISQGLMNTTPASGGAPLNQPTTWVLQDIPNYNVAYGGAWDVTHLEDVPGSSGFAFRVPYLALKNNPTKTCDAASTGYSGHAGWLNYIAGASGVADTLSFCAKDASNTYAWRSLLPTKGRATLAAGTVTVSTTAASTTAAYSLTNCGVGGTQGMLAVGTVTAGTSFVINSSSATDTSTVCWVIQ